MGIVTNKRTRRQFLVGTGNTLLALPFLPSLFHSSVSSAQTVTVPKRMMLFCIEHSPLDDVWVPNSAASTNSGTIGNLKILSKSLKSLGSLSELSPLLTSPIFETLRKNDQLTLVRGFDMIYGAAHEDLGGLGGSKNHSCPTIDTIIEASKSLYSDSEAYMTKAIRIDTMLNWLSNQKVGSALQAVTPYGHDLNKYFRDTHYYTLPEMYGEVFKSLTGGTVSPEDTTNKLKTNILNRVFESFKSYKSNRKISSDDVARLDQHLGFLSDIQKKINIVIPTSTCTKPANPGSQSDAKVIHELYLDLLVAAFKCGLTKFGAMKFDSHDPQWMPGLDLDEGQVVHEVIHGDKGKDEKLRVHKLLNTYIYNAIGDRFLTGLSQVEDDSGRTYLENMITAFMPKFGLESASVSAGHGGWNTQTLLVGSMGGRLKSGNFLLYPTADAGNYQTRRLPHNALFITLFNLLGIPASEYQQYSNTGQGWGVYENLIAKDFSTRFYGGLTELL